MLTLLQHKTNKVVPKAVSQVETQMRLTAAVETRALMCKKLQHRAIAVNVTASKQEGAPRILIASVLDRRKPMRYGQSTWKLFETRWCCRYERRHGHGKISTWTR